MTAAYVSRYVHIIYLHLKKRVSTAIPRVTRFQLTRIPLARHFN